MKKSSLGKLGILAAALSIAIPVAINSSFAQQFLPDPLTQDQDVLACASNADLNYADFISSSIAYDGFVDYWEDIFAKNRCEQMDIENVLRKIKVVRTNIRASFYACDDDRANKLGITYNKLLAELYFVRNLAYTFPDDPTSDLVTINPDLHGEMKTKFVSDKGYFTDDDFEQLYRGFMLQYKTRLDPTNTDSYIKCEDPSFDNLKAKWQEFLDTAGGFGSGYEAAARKVEKEVKRLESTPAQNYGNLYLGFIDLNVNGLDPLDGLQQIYNDSKTNLPFADVGVTHRDLIESSNQARSNFNAAKSKAEKMAKYEYLYLNTTDSLRDSLEKKLKESNLIIKDTFQPLSSLSECVGTVYSRQCKSSE